MIPTEWLLTARNDRLRFRRLAMFIAGFRAHNIIANYWYCITLFTDSHDDNNDDEEMQKTLAILIGLIAGVALVIVFLSCLAKLCDRKGTPRKFKLNFSIRSL